MDIFFHFSKNNMAYLEQGDENLIDDLLTRKEFYWLKKWDHKNASDIDEIIPRFMLDDEIARSGYLRLLGHQMFTRNYFNPLTNYNRMHIKWSTGAGKTLGGLTIAMSFIRYYRLEHDLGSAEIGSVFIIGFAERAFKNELLRYPEFGFLSREERIKLDKLKRLAAAGSKSDLDKYKELTTRVKKRFSNRKGNGFFRFFGYKAFVNRIFIAQPNINLNEMTEEQIRVALSEGKIKYNETLLKEFKNSLIICDEIHNVYNSAEKNNWGIAIQAVLDHEPSVRCVTMSATPLNNSPTEIVDLLNLLLPSKQRVQRSDFFSNANNLKPGALEKIAELSRGRFSFLVDVNPKHYPKVVNCGTPLKEIPYLKFIRCPMSQFHYSTYKEVYTGALSQDSQYLVDFALPNPEDEKGIGIFQTNQIKKLIPAANDKWKTKYGIDYRNSRIVGDILLRKNIEKYSTKYARMLDELMLDIKSNNGKIFIYHNAVHMSGVLFIEQLLLKNGFLDDSSNSVDNTICMRCGKQKKEHSKEEIKGGGATNINGSDIDYTKQKSIVVKDEDERVMYSIKKYKNAYMVLPTQHESLLHAEPEVLDNFYSIINNLDSSLPVFIYIHVKFGKKLIKELISNGFEVDKQGKRRVILVRHDHAITGGSQKNNQKNNQKPTTPCAHAGYVAGKHRFTPARFIMAHSEIDKAKMEHMLERFNSPDNIDGSQFLILVGSQILKESYDIKALQNEYIMSKPDNIPTFIQIRGRAVRKDSHKGLPPDKHLVRIKIFTSCLPVKQETGLDKGEYKLSYEEEKYREKVASFQVIQKIEKVIHENAIDSAINHDKVQRSIQDDPLGPLPYKPSKMITLDRELTLDKLNVATFNVHHSKSEVALIKSLVKRLFIEIAGVWEYNDLLRAVRSPPNKYETEINTRLISEDNFLIAMSQLCWDNSPHYVDPILHEDLHSSVSGTSLKAVYDSEDTLTTGMLSIQGSAAKKGGAITRSSVINNTSEIIEHMFDSHDKIIAMPDGQDNIIVPIPDGKSQYYMLFPLSNDGYNPEIDIDLPYRISKQEEEKKININSFMQMKKIDFDYDDKKRIFYHKYADIAIENMQNVICEYGTTFHIKFVEECIEYVFNVWTSPTLEKSEYHEFYIKMLYYYDLLSLVMWAYTSKPRVFKEYSKYAIPVKAKDIKLKAMSKYERRKEELDDISPEDTSDLATSGVINLLKSTYNRTSNAWIPEEFREQYNSIVAKSLSMFIGKKKKNKFLMKVSADLLPIGHYISKFPRLYLPEKGWDENPTYLQNEQEFKENNMIVGFDDRSNTGVHIRFKIRNPIHNIKKYKDSRQTEKGTVCKSKSKDYLKSVARKLGAVLPDKVNVEDLCVVIRSKLIRLELKERIKKSNIKYFYFFYEQRPETRAMT